MPVFSSFISYRNSKPKTNKPTKQPFYLRRLGSSTVLDSDAGAGIVDINEKNQIPLPPRFASLAGEKKLPQVKATVSPVKLDLEFPPAPSTDWFSPDILEDGFLSREKGAGSSSGSGLSKKRSDEDDKEGMEPKSEFVENDDATSAYSWDEVARVTPVSKLKDDVRKPEKISKASPRVYTPSSFRRPPPAPIQIPNAALHAPKVSIQRQSSSSRTRSNSRPDSQHTLDELSAISGTTLARALIANTFSISSDNRASRYRSGTIPLARQDSATLPHGESSSSLYWRDKKAGGDIILTPDSANFMDSRAPPIPHDAELLYIPPKTPRRSASDTKSRRSGDTSLHSSSISSRPHIDEPSPLLPSSRSNSPLELAPSSQVSRRISRISEASSMASTSDAPSGAHIPETTPSDIPFAQPHTDQHKKDTPPLGITPQSSDHQFSDAEASDIDRVLDSYQFLSDLDTYEDSRPLYSSKLSQRSGNSSRSRTNPRGETPGARRAPQRGNVDMESSSSSSRGQIVQSISRSNLDSGLLTSALESVFPRHALLPIGDRPYSIPQSPFTDFGSPLFNSPSSTISPLSTEYSNRSRGKVSSTTSEASPPAFPPHIRNILTGHRSGNTPSPIIVVRDSKDYNAYKITITPVKEGSVGSTPTTSNSDLRQQFPETPDAFSPLWSSGTAASTELPLRDPFGGPRTPGSAQSTLAQKVMLNRATTTYSMRSQARHQKRLNRRHPHPYSSMALMSEEEDPPVGTSVQYSDFAVPPSFEPRLSPVQSSNLSPSVHSAEASVHERPPSTPSRPPSDHSKLSLRIESSLNSPQGPSQKGSRASSVNSRSTSRAPTPVIPATVSVGLSPHKPKALSIVPSPSRSPSTPSEAESPPNSNALPATLFHPPSPMSLFGLPHKSDPQAPLSIVTSLEQRPSPVRPATRPPPLFTPLVETSTKPFADDSMQASTSVVDTSVNPVSQPTPIHPVHVPFSSPPRPTLYLRSAVSPSPSSDMSSEALRVSPAPPPYTSVIYDQVKIIHDTGPAEESNQGPVGYVSLTNNPAISVRNPLRADPVVPRTRTRPPLPAGPRRPSASAITSTSFPRGRNGSTSSENAPTPKFHIPPLKWRGYTMEAAKWTFTSTQLQGIVSRAIRQSAEASSIRLLRPETLDQEIPDEMRRLELLKTDVKTNYRSATRRRWAILGSLSSLMSGSAPANSSAASRLLQELSEVLITLDQLAEELHSVDEQFAQISTLRDVHSASALAMALRKLNSSFLKQVSENQALRSQLEAAEAERDEAWKHAQDIANEYDDLTAKAIENGSSSPKPSSRRSSRVLAVRKSSIRVSKAGLRSSSAVRSQRSSFSSNGNRASVLSNLPSAYSVEEVPPVPPMPRRRPGIITDLTNSMRISRGLSTIGTPDSETRLMVKAQQELYDMLGISVNDSRPHSRRPQSMTSTPVGEMEQDSRPPTSQRRRNSFVATNGGRPASLPDGFELRELYDVLTVDQRRAMLALGIMTD